MKLRIHLQVNGEAHDLLVPPTKTLLEVLREDLGLTGTKRGCNLGECGACTVLLQGRPVNSCLTLAVEARGREILTIESLAPAGGLDPLQEAFAICGSVQCGFCTPGMIMTAKALLDEIPEPGDRQILEALSGNICRCTGYTKIIEAVKGVARQGSGQRSAVSHREMSIGQKVPPPADQAVATN